ncbi:helix-turn-helix domain-containing protein [Paenibacillus thailandensis]|uniref:Helix-turn-helix domain-containing protein n=1 Tax=Paenibacillus thailandensis TaxID=393250 RepID=A0ABW5R472_9BACL
MESTERLTHLRFVLSPSEEQPLPLTVESLGHNRDQEKVDRPQGYPLYHWIQTERGEGRIAYDDKTVSLPPGSGVLLIPHAPHRYAAVEGSGWETFYLTFGGSASEAILESLGMNRSAYYKWEPDTPFTRQMQQMLRRSETDDDVFGLQLSADAYRFLVMLKKYGQLHNNAPISRNVEKLRPLIEWMEGHLADPDIGLPELAAVLGVSPRHLNGLFRQTFGLSPYAYFINLRIRKAKELLVMQPSAPVRQIGELVGFRDASHFVATFRRSASMTPDQFRRLH